MIIDKLNSRFLEIHDEYEYRFVVYNKNDAISQINKAKRLINSINCKEIEIHIKILKI